MTVEKSQLAKLRVPFAENQISKLPKPTKAQTDEVRNDFKKGIRCEECGAWHHPKVVHLDYVGHAALTDRLLDTDEAWSWEPAALDPMGLPAFDANGGLWIKLTVCGVTRMGYGSADGKTGGDAIKEIIGDGLRNAAMRFGAALDLWHKGDLHAYDPVEGDAKKPEPKAKKDAIEPDEGWGDWTRGLIKQVSDAPDGEALDKIKNDPVNKVRINSVKKVDKAMFDAIAEAFTIRRAVFSSEVPF